MTYQRRRRGGISVVALVLATTVGVTGSLALTGRAEAQAATSAVDLAGTTRALTSQTSARFLTAAPGAVQRVTYAGLHLDVPAGWTVVDLTADPSACVRFDVHAVYLGNPGAVQDCPARIPGRAEAILLQPMPNAPPYGTTTLTPGAVPDLTPAQQLAGEVIARISGTDVLLTAELGTEPGMAMTVLRSIAVAAGTPSAGASATPGQASLLAAAANPAPIDRSFTWRYGLGFDACTAPALTSMQSWLTSSYRSIGIYIGGAARACGQANLTASWVRSIATMGWRAQPIYVGLQAPCMAFTSKITYGQEWAQGRAAALDAIARAKALGIGQGSDIYYDMESYPQSTACSGSVRAFLSSWTTTLQYNGYSSGVYSSLSTGIADLANGGAQPGFVPPNKIWIGSWNGELNTSGAPYVAATQWSPYRRMHQYAGGHNESHGGVTINIDSNYLDTDPNRGNPFGRIDSTPMAPGTVTARGWALDPDTSAPIMVQMYIDGRANALTWASQSRPDVAVAYPAAGPNHGFTLTMSTTPGPHTVCLYAINAGPGFSAGFGCRTVNVPSNNPFGHVDSISTIPGKVTASGWAVDPNTSAPIMVQMYIDGRANSLTWASRSRPDVARVYPAAGPNHGFTLTMPTTPGPHTVCLYAINTGPGVSAPIGCRNANAP